MVLCKYRVFNMTPNTPIENLLEAILFFRGGSVKIKDLVIELELSLEEVESGLTSLEMSLMGRGLRIVKDKDSVALTTAPEAHELIEKIRRDELDGPLGKAGLETIAIIIFRGPISRSDIEYVRGVNCSTIIRSLLIRGLIERIDNANDKRSFLYQTTPELPAYLGISRIEDIPEFAATREKIEKVFAERDVLEMPESSLE
ncbi:SMC-Scp complex subunit ScpB [Patescibacteria group bacterium]|nr:MAG: SMC-Scp complex subunit ScpB [Patescibacteria group bacterium]